MIRSLVAAALFVARVKSKKVITMFAINELGIHESLEFFFLLFFWRCAIKSFLGSPSIQKDFILVDANTGVFDVEPGPHVYILPGVETQYLLVSEDKVAYYLNGSAATFSVVTDWANECGCDPQPFDGTVSGSNFAALGYNSADSTPYW